MGQGSPELVAFKLMQEIAYAEGVDLFADGSGKKADRAWLLQVYYQGRRAWI
jgi:hypothetical protein